jgi:hypothetical protein
MNTFDVLKAAHELGKVSTLKKQKKSWSDSLAELSVLHWILQRVR